MTFHPTTIPLPRACRHAPTGYTRYVALVPCNCGTRRGTHVSSNDGWGWTIHCNDCYDGAPDAGKYGFVAQGGTLTEAASEWNEEMDERTPS